MDFRVGDQVWIYAYSGGPVEGVVSEAVHDGLFDWYKCKTDNDYYNNQKWMNYNLFNRPEDVEKLIEKVEGFITYLQHAVGEIKAKCSARTDVEDVFFYWNKRSPLAHKKLTDGGRKNILSVLKEYKKEELFLCIDNYSKIVSGDEYWYNYRSSLEEFFRPGKQKPAPYMKFLPDRFVESNFFIKKNIFNGKTTVEL